MISILKQMGSLCQERQEKERSQSFYRRRFNELQLVNGEQADAHRTRFLELTEEIDELTLKIKKLHERIKIQGNC